MKPGSLCFALGLAQLATCAPMAADRTGGADDVSSTARGVPATFRVAITSFSLKSADIARLSPRRRLRLLHQRHQPDPVLRPPLSRHGLPGPTQSTRGPDLVVRLPSTLDDEDDTLELRDTDLAVPPPSAVRGHVPCHGQGPSGRERNDTLVVVLAVAFMVVVVVMETCSSIFRRQGVIRLEQPASQALLSVRADPDSPDDIGDEKQGLRV